MKVCVLGDGLVSLSLAKTLANQAINVDIFGNKKRNINDKLRTLAISKNNVEFFNNNIANIEKLLWNVRRIEVFTENLQKEKLINFEKDNKNIFSIIRNFELDNFLISELKKNKCVKFKKNFDFKNLNESKYKLIINCENNNLITKKFFYKKDKKNYYSYAHTTIIKHKKLLDNCVAFQIFTKDGPIAFLPISPKETSVVFSARGNEKIDLKKVIKKYNNRFKIITISNVASFKLTGSNLRSYYHKNILAFGDILHRLHPLAGQGFNMSIRDIKELLKLIKFRKNHGLDIDKSICTDFEKNTKHKNYIFSNSIDFLYEFFNFESKNKSNLLSKVVQVLGKNNKTNKLFTKFADEGIIF